MEEKKTPNTIAAQEDYARQLAGLSVRVCAMTQEQRERNAEKIAEPISAFASISPEILVSQPTIIVGLCSVSFVRT